MKLTRNIGNTDPKDLIQITIMIRILDSGSGNFYFLALTEVVFYPVLSSIPVTTFASELHFTAAIDSVMVCMLVVYGNK